MGRAKKGPCRRVRNGKFSHYYATINGEQIILLKEDNFDAAYIVYGEKLKAAKEKAENQEQVEELKEILFNPPEGEEITVASVLLKFLDSNKEFWVKDTYRFYFYPIQMFINWLYETKQLDLTVSKFESAVVKRWIQTKKIDDPDNGIKPISNTTEHNYLRAVKEPFNWAMKRRHLKKLIVDHPLMDLVKPAQNTRNWVEPEEWIKITEVIKGDFFDLLEFMYDSGARPCEAAAVHAKNFDKKNERIYFDKPPKKVKNVQDRSIYLPPRSLAIIKRLCERYPTGPLFRTVSGVAWTNESMGDKAREYNDELGFNLQCGAMRHTFCTNQLIADVSLQKIAARMGHNSIGTLMRHYNKLKNSPKNLMYKGT